MKRFTLISLMLVLALFFKVKAQEATVNEKLSEVNDKVNGLTERLATDEADLQKLTKIKVSGYIQAQYQSFENLGVQPNSYFSLRRVRVKFTYETTKLNIHQVSAKLLNVQKLSPRFILANVRSVQNWNLIHKAFLFMFN